MQAPRQARNDADAVQKETARTARQEQNFVDKRRVAVAQSDLARMLDNSPRLVQQQALSDIMHDGPRMVGQRKEQANHTGLPDRLKSGIESLSGMRMDHVRVHYNSDKPAHLQAHAYAQGSDIYLGAGQEKHLPHEAWHVVQQAEGRVRPTVQMKANAINDDPALEKEADVMGEKAAQFEGHHGPNLVADEGVASVAIQRVAASPTGEIAFETSEPDKLHTASQTALSIQRKLDFSHSGVGGVITKCVFTKRPGWTSAVRKAMPSTAGYDRGHLIPWMAVRLEIEFDMTGMDLQEAYDYLQNKEHTPDAKTWAAVEKAIRAYGRAENSDLDNLEYEDSSDNRSNGARLPSAAALWQCAHEINDFEWDPPYQFNGKTINTKEDAKKACLEVGVPDKLKWSTAEQRFGEGSNCVIQ